MLYFDVSSRVKRAWVLEACSSLVLGHFRVRMTWEHLARVWWSGVVTFVGHNHMG